MLRNGVGDGAAVETASTREATPITRLPTVRETIRVVPEHYGNAPEAPTYLLRHWSDRKRAYVYEVLYEKYGDRVTNEEVRECAREGIATVVVPEERPALLKMIDELEVLMSRAGDGKPLPEDEQEHYVAQLKQYAQLDRVLSRKYAPYRELVSLKTKWEREFDYLAIRALLVGWEHVPAAFSATNGFATEESIECIPDLDLRAIRAQVATMLYLSREQKKT